MKTVDIIPWLRHLFHKQIGERSSGFESQQFLFKWLFLSVLIGVGSGIGMLLFYEAIRWLTQGGLELLVGYFPPEPGGGKALPGQCLFGLLLAPGCCQLSPGLAL